MVGAVDSAHSPTASPSSDASPSLASDTAAKRPPTSSRVLRSLPWITHSATRGLEVCAEARDVVAAQPSPVCVVIFYGDSGREERSEIVLRTLFPKHTGRGLQALREELAAEETAHEGSAVVVRLWRKALRVPTGEGGGGGGAVSVLVGDAMPCEGMEEGLALALGLLVGSHVVYVGKRLLDEDRILGLRAVQRLTNLVRVEAGGVEDGSLFSHHLPR